MSRHLYLSRHRRAARVAAIALGTATAVALVAVTALAEDVYVDPSRSVGCPGNGAIENPYCDWRSVIPMVGGVRYLQKRGTTYWRTLKVHRKNSDIDEGTIYLGAYGDGSPPRIRIDNRLSGASDPERWRSIGGGVWTFDTTGYTSGDPRVLLLDGRRAFGRARAVKDLCQRRGTQVVEWFHEDSTLYLCSQAGNPADVHRRISGMQVSPGAPDSAIKVGGQRDVVIDGFTVEGGSGGAIVIFEGSSNVEVKNSEIGRDSPSGIVVSSQGTPNRRISIHDNTIDSGIRWGAVGYAPLISGEGVAFVDSAEDGEIHNNVLVAWPHNGVYLVAMTHGVTGVRRVQVFGNEFHCGSGSSYFDYCRPFGVDGYREGAAEFNSFFDNRMHDFSVRAQANGSNNAFVGNFCYRTVNSPAKTFPTGQCFSFQPYASSGHNLLANNTMYEIADVAVEFVSGNGGTMSGHQVVNNIMQNCGTAGIGARRDACIAIESADSVGAQVITDNIFFNSATPPRIAYRAAGSQELSGLVRQSPDLILRNHVQNPEMVDPSSGNFALTTRSPARNSGVLNVGPLGEPSNVDIGAWQSSGDEWRWMIRTPPVRVVPTLPKHLQAE